VNSYPVAFAASATCRVFFLRTSLGSRPTSLGLWIGGEAGKAGAREHPSTTLERLPPTEVFQTPVAGFRGGSRVAPTLIDTRLGDLDVVDSEYTPEVIAFIARPRRAHMDCCPIVAVARRSEIPLGLPEGGAIRATDAAVGVGGRS
jgi:hypothetical protein